MSLKVPVLLVASALVLAVPAAAQILPTQNPVAGEYIVTLEEGVARRPADPISAGPSVPEVAAGIARSHGGEILHNYEYALQGFSIRLPERAAERLANSPRIARVEENGLVFMDGSQSSPSWGLDRVDQRSLPLNATHTYPWTAPAVHAFVLDTGLRVTHNEFTGRVGAGYDAVRDGNGIDDCRGHGTHVAGTLGGTKYGVAKDVTVHPVRVLRCDGTGTWGDVIEGVDWVTANSHLQPAVANMSLSGGAHSTADDAVRNSIAAGIVYVVAAGNDNHDACSNSPARVDEAITVGATTEWDSRSSFSNYGYCVDIFAPGSVISSAWHTSDTSAASLSGTSMATPHVAGTAALFLHAHSGFTPAQVMAALKCDATTGVLSNLGAGSPNRLIYSRVDIDDPPRAAFFHSCPTLYCTFSSTGCDDVKIQSYQWSFGDGSTGSGSAPGHMYPASGLYTVTLTVTDTGGQTDQESQSVLATDPYDDCPTCPTCRICPEEY